MGHLSLYRRFRPATFDEMVRQEHVVRILKNQIMGGAVGHAYLFCGPRGTGKTSVARIFARAVNCENPQDGSPCGVCPACRALEAGSLDVSEIDAASNNGVNEMRDLREKVQYPPVTGKYKVYIVDEVHMLTDSAFNALLKTLEEPPAHAVFILATTEPQKLPATILSRCMRLDFKLIPEEDLRAHLKRILKEIGKEYEEEAVAAIARAGAGSDRDMLSIAEMCIAYGGVLTYEGVNAVLGAADFHETCALVRLLLGADAGGAIEKTEHILAEGKAVGVLLHDLIEMFNRVAVAKTCRNAGRLLALPEDEFLAVKETAEGASGAQIARAADILSRTESDLRFVTSPRIALETALLRIARPEAEQSTEALLARIERLEAALSRLSSAPVERREAATSQQPSLPETPRREAPEEVPPEEVPPPEEEPFFGDGYFSDESPVPEPVPTPIPTREEDKQPPQEAAPQETRTADAVFGQFIRLLRKSRMGVLFTMCADLEAKFEGETLVLYTDSETIEASLKRKDHVDVMQNVFQQVGVEAFEVRLKGKQVSEAEGVARLKRDFPDYPIELK